MKNTITKNQLYLEYQPLVASLGVEIVNIMASETPEEYKMNLIIVLKDGEVGVNECSRVHKIIKTRMTVQLPPEEYLNLEVSTPGLQRTLEDAHEFSLFCGKRVRVLLPSLQKWVSGIIASTNEDSVTLSNCIVEEDEKSKDELMKISFDSIQKAKLEYIWEDRSHGN